MKIMAVDPGSTTGLVVFDTETKEIDMVELHVAVHKDYDRKIKYLADALTDCISEYATGELSLICFETFVMQGVGGKQLQKLIGAYISRVPESVEIRHVFNTTVKKIVGGIGSADKEKVADGVLKYFSSNKESKEEIQKRIYDEEWDITDAFAIGIAGALEK